MVACEETSGGKTAGEWPWLEEGGRRGGCGEIAASGLIRKRAIEAASSSSARLEEPFSMGVRWLPQDSATGRRAALP